MGGTAGPHLEQPPANKANDSKDNPNTWRENAHPAERPGALSGHAFSHFLK